MSITQRLIGGFTVLTSLGAILGGVSAMLFFDFEANATRVKVDAIPGTASAGQIKSSVLHTYGDILEAGLIADPAERALRVKEVQERVEEFDKLCTFYEGTITQPDDRVNWEKYLAVRGTWDQAIESCLKTAMEKDNEALKHAIHDTLEPAYHVIEGPLNVIMEWNISAGDKLAAEIYEQAGNLFLCAI
ncbi:MAG TPA: MCP four helix bundle domain-containing protein [Phycisphaerales bacterium]|nr:MCP four helix bundle domain-containing protein [Phycisphaerales bacterium]